jgi:fused signal recognition particle receptor
LKETPTKLIDTSKGAMVVAVRRELALPVKYVGPGRRLKVLQPFDAQQFARALLEED